MDNKKKLKFGSYNCKHFGVDKYVIMQTLLVACGLLFIQKHCMYKTQFVQRLNSFSPNSVSIVSSSMDESVPLIGRPNRGCLIIRSANISCKVDTIECISKRLCAVKVTVENIECDNGYANHDLFEYVDVLNEVSDICNKTAAQHFALGGDFNAELTRDTPQTRALRSSVNNEQMFYIILHIDIYL